MDHQAVHEPGHDRDAATDQPEDIVRQALACVHAIELPRLHRRRSFAGDLFPYI